MAADLGFFGKVARKDQVMYPAYSIVAGAVVGGDNFRLAKKIDTISARSLPDFVADLLASYSSKKDRYSSFSQYIDNGGEADIRALCDTYREVPSFDDDKNYYFDWGADQVFSLVGKGVGECSAGLFDLIDIDRNRIQELRGALSEKGDDDDVTGILYQIVLSVSRMLLITRGVEASTDDMVFDAFLKHFLLAGLVDTVYADIVEHAKNRNLIVFAEQRDRILDLADSVERLYQSMDDSLRFPTDTEIQASIESAESDEEDVDSDLFRDYRGIACPMNFVKVKVDMTTMASGEKLRVLLDDGSPIENVPRSVDEEGHAIISQKKKGDYWEVVIRKK